MDAGAAAEARALSGCTVMVTAGPTREALDPVRFLSNHSSGKMGYAIAEAARDAGATVLLLSGPVALPPPAGIEVVPIESAEELFAATHSRIDDVDIFVGAAAVADYRPAAVENNKIKKSDSDLSVEMVRTPDVLASVAKLADGPFTVGFAAETHRLREYATKKLKAKGLDMIVGNEVGSGKAFGQDDNAVHVFWQTGDRAYPLTSKRELADDLVMLIAERYGARQAAATVTELPSLARKD